MGYNEDLTTRCKPEEYPEIKFYDRMDCTKEETTTETVTEEKKEETPIATQAVKETKQEPAQKTKTALS